MNTLYSGSFFFFFFCYCISPLRQRNPFHDRIPCRNVQVCRASACPGLSRSHARLSCTSLSTLHAHRATLSRHYFCVATQGFPALITPCRDTVRSRDTGLKGLCRGRQNFLSWPALSQSKTLCHDRNSPYTGQLCCNILSLLALAHPIATGNNLPLRKPCRDIERLCRDMEKLKPCPALSQHGKAMSRHFLQPKTVNYVMKRVESCRDPRSKPVATLHSLP